MLVFDYCQQKCHFGRQSALCNLQCFSIVQVCNVLKVDLLYVGSCEGNLCHSLLYGNLSVTEMACFDVVKDFVALWPRNIATRRAYRFCFISNGSVLIHTRHCERLTLYHKVASCDWAVRAARQTLTLPQQEEHDKAVSVRSSDGTYAIAAETHQESLVLLEWPALCRQVAAFANTSTAAQRIVESGLTMGRSKVTDSVSTVQHKNGHIQMTDIWKRLS